jgi:ADP-ribosylation factor GTPase-activating protein 2/3
LTEFFSKHGGQSLLPPGNSDARGRYSSRQAQLYREELARRIADDARKCVNMHKHVAPADNQEPTRYPH